MNDDFNKEFDKYNTLDGVREKIKSDYVKKLHETETKLLENMLYNKYRFTNLELIDFYTIGCDALNLFKKNTKHLSHLNENDAINVAFNFKMKNEC